MRRRHLAGLGLGLLTGSSTLLAQAPPPQSSPGPAARITLIQPLQTDQARGQTGDTKSPMSTGNGTPMKPMGTGGVPLPQPQSYPTPNVTELRSGPGAVLGGPIPLGQPVILGPGMPSGIPLGQPIPVGPGYPVGGTVVSPPSVFPGDNGGPALDLETPLYTGGATVAGPFGLLAGPRRLQLNAEFISWWVRPGTVPPLVTSAPPGGIGALGQPGTQVLFGDDFLTSRAMLGGRFGATYWLGATQQWGIDGNIFFLGRNGTENTFYSGANGVLARPFFNLNDGGTPFSQLVAAPGLAIGSVAVNNEVSMWGAEVNVRRHLCSAPCARLDGFVGFRYLRFTESLMVTESFARTPGSNTAIGVPAALFGTVSDSIRTENNFYAPQIGLIGEVRRGRWFVEGRTSVAMGTVFQTATLAGQQNIQFDNGAGVFPGGLLVTPGANQGTFGTRRFGVMPEVGLKLGVHVTENLRLAVGYNFLYLSSVIRPGGQIDQGLDVTKIPNFPLPGNPQPIAGRPRVPLSATDVYAQGISFSLQWFW
jgi:hypothetical protein